VRTSTEGKPQTGISFLLIDMKSPGITVRPIILLDGEHEVNEVFFDNVEVPAENLIGEENKGWTYAKHLLSHERTNIADVNRAKRELERLKRIAKAEGVWDDMPLPRPDRAAGSRHRRAGDDGAARAVGREERQAEPGRGRPAEDPRQRDPAALHRADDAGRRPLHPPFIHEAMEAGWQGDHVGRMHLRAAGRHLLQHAQDHDLRRQSNEVQRNIVAQTVLRLGS
jgi:alkylation response protein AidB-like acyl-CoA dehydrogenase